MKSWRSMAALACAAFAVCAGSAGASEWRGVVDGAGFTWARVRIVNLGAEASNWSISGARTALASDAYTADVDASLDWDGAVAAGSSEIVWVYGRAADLVTVANADGGTSAFYGQAAIVAGADGELVITVAADGTSIATIEPADAYGAPAVTGTLPQ